MSLDLSGIKTLFTDEGAILTLIIFIVATALCAIGKLPGAYWTGAVTSLSGIYTVCKHRNGNGS